MAGLGVSRPGSELGIKQAKVGGRPQRDRETASLGRTCSEKEPGDLGSEAKNGFMTLKSG